jgi:hypothetical protein
VVDASHLGGLTPLYRPNTSTNRIEPRTKTLLGGPVTSINFEEGIYVDKERNVDQLTDKGGTKPIAVEHLPGRDKTELEVLLEASLKGGKGAEPDGDSKRTHRKIRNNGGKRQQAPPDGEHSS